MVFAAAVERVEKAQGSPLGSLAIGRTYCCGKPSVCRASPPDGGKLAAVSRPPELARTGDESLTNGRAIKLRTCRARPSRPSRNLVVGSNSNAMPVATDIAAVLERFLAEPQFVAHFPPDWQSWMRLGFDFAKPSNSRLHEFNDRVAFCSAEWNLSSHPFGSSSVSAIEYVPDGCSCSNTPRRSSYTFSI